jgi:hypothetical protein
MGVGGPLKRRIGFVFKKTVCFVLKKKRIGYVLTKTVWVRLYKDGLVVLKKTGFGCV